MNNKSSKLNALPDFFHTKNPIVANTILLKYRNRHYWMLAVNKNQDDICADESSKNVCLPPYEDNDDGMIDCCDVEENYEIVQTKSGKFMTSFHVAGALKSVIIGPKGQTLKALEAQTKTLIKVPRINEIGNVKITGHTERDVASARNQVAMVVLNKRERMAVTHFLSIPIISEEINNNFKIFQNEILKDRLIRDIYESIFQTPTKLHLTITTLTLLDEAEIEEAKKIIESCYRDVISPAFPKNKTYYITVRGIEIMNDDPTEVNVLYGKVELNTKEETEKFQQVCNNIVNYLYKKGLIKKQYDKVKLHVTLINTSFRKKTDDYDKNQITRARETFNASQILKRYKNFFFGKIAFSNMQLSIRFSTDTNGYYNSALTISIL